MKREGQGQCLKLSDTLTFLYSCFVHVGKRLAFRNEVFDTSAVLDTQ